MDVARERLVELLANVNPSAAALVVAKHQSAGRGRQGRSWVSEGGAFLGTFLFRTTAPVALLSGYSLAIGVGVARALRECGATVSLKWPNDIVVRRGAELSKLGGVLIEVQEDKQGRVLLVGIGLNLKAAPTEVNHSVALADLVSHHEPLGLEHIAGVLAHHLLGVQQEWQPGGGFKAFRKRWEELSCYDSGSTMLTIEVSPGVTVHGAYIGVDDSGALVLLVNGEPRLIHSGHVVATQMG